MRLLCFKKGVFGMDFTLPPLLTVMVDRGNGLLWGSVLIYLLIGAGLYFTVMTRAIQIRYFGHMFKLLRGSRQSNGGISSFQALSTSLAARVGTAARASTGSVGLLGVVWVARAGSGRVGGAQGSG